MTPIRWTIFGAVLTFLAVASPMALTQSIFTQKEISLDAAQAIAQRAMEKCRADGYKISVTVLDASGEVKVYLHDDGATQITIDGSRHKAYTALVFKRSSAETGKALSPLQLLSAGADGIGGGVPIKKGDEVVGAVGVGGGTAPGADEACANAGIAKIADQLK